MAWTLGATTLPEPNRMVEKNQSVSSNAVSIGNSRYKDTSGLKKRTWILEWTSLIQTDFDSILSEWESNLDGNTKVFTVTDLSINSTVNIEISDRNFLPATDYRCRLSIELMEV